MNVTTNRTLTIKNNFLVLLGLAVLMPTSWSTAASFGTAGNSGYKSYPTTVDASTRDSNQQGSRRGVESLFNRPNVTPFAPESHNLSIKVGQVFLTGELSSQFENAIGTQVNYTYGVSDLFAFDTSFGYSSHSNGNSGDLSLAHLVSGVRTNLVFYDQLIPFASFGLGFYRTGITQGAVDYSSVLFGLNFGAGVDLALSRNFFFGSKITYHDMFDSTKTGPDNIVRNVGGAFISFLVHTGMTF